MKEKPIYEQLGYDPDPPFYAPTSKPIVTNYDLFKTMSIDELENTLLLEICELTGMSEYEDDGIDKRIPIDCPGDCQICLHEWLREEVKEGETQC